MHSVPLEGTCRSQCTVFHWRVGLSAVFHWRVGLSAQCSIGG